MFRPKLNRQLNRSARAVTDLSFDNLQGVSGVYSSKISLKYRFGLGRRRNEGHDYIKHSRKESIRQIDKQIRALLHLNIYLMNSMKSALVSPVSYKSEAKEEQALIQRNDLTDSIIDTTRAVVYRSAINGHRNKIVTSSERKKRAAHNRQLIFPDRLCFKKDKDAKDQADIFNESITKGWALYRIRYERFYSGHE